MSMGFASRKEFRDAFTEHIEQSLGAAEIVPHTDASTSTGTLNDIPVNALEPYHHHHPKRPHKEPPKEKSVEHPKFAVVVPVPHGAPAGDSNDRFSTQKSKSATTGHTHHEESRDYSLSMRSASFGPSTGSSAYSGHSGHSEASEASLSMKSKKPSRILTILPDGEENPTVPRICCNHFPVKDLHEKEKICEFFSKVLMVKVVQFMAITVWLVLADSEPGLRRGIRRGRVYCLGVCGSLFGLITIFVQLFAFRGPPGLALTLIILILKTWTFAIALSASDVMFKSPLLVFITTNLVMSSGILMTMFWRGNIDVNEKLGISCNAPVTATSVTTVLFFFVRKINQMELSGEEFVKLWLPFFLITAFALQLFVFEMHTIIKGRRFPVSGADWMYAATFL